MDERKDARTEGGTWATLNALPHSTNSGGIKIDPFKSVLSVGIPLTNGQCRMYTDQSQQFTLNFGSGDLNIMVRVSDIFELYFTCRYILIRSVVYLSSVLKGYQVLFCLRSCTVDIPHPV